MIKEKCGDKLISKKVWDVYPISANTYLNFFKDNAKNFYSPDDGFEILSKINFPIFAVMGRKDDAITVPIEDAMRMIKEKAISSPRCEYEILGDAIHSYREHKEKLAKIVLN